MQQVNKMNAMSRLYKLVYAIKYH